LPGNANRPGASLPGVNRPGANRPGTNRPSIGNTKPAPLPGNPNRPGIGENRPSTLPGNTNRPGIGGNRPSTLPGNPNRPGIGGNRPSTLPGNPNRPGIGGNRPSTLPGIANRPGNRPGFGNNQRPLPGIDNRPDWGNGNINRPIIGGNRPNIGNNTNINIGQIGNNHVNRPNWDIDPGFSRPSWGLGDNWHHHWHDNSIHHHHHGWYNGCWHGYWGSNWYAPVAWGAVGWGLGAWTNSWGTSAAFYNPYYAVPTVAASVPYDYSQPVVIYNNVSSEGGAGGEAQAQSSSTDQQGLASFDEGLAAFRGGDYVGALSQLNSALKLLPNDPVVHEVRCLALFATGDYNAAAAGLNSLLAVAPGMDWTTMSGLYGNAEEYTNQLRKLERYAELNPKDASAHFVLAYHYLVTGSKDEAVNALRVVTANQPKDVTAKRMLEALVPADQARTESVPADLPAADPNSSVLTTDLVGTWKAQAGESAIELTITEDSEFVWKVQTNGRAAAELSGNLSGDSDGIQLITSDQGTMGGTVESKGQDAWRFSIDGAPKSDPGLLFQRVK
jgi:hypothetical protein